MKTYPFFKVCRCLLIMLIAIHATQAVAQRNKSRRTRQAKREVVTQAPSQPSTLDVAHLVDSIYSSNFFVSNPELYFDETKDSIANFLQNKNIQITTQLQEHYYEAFYTASENEQLSQAIDNAFKYLMIGGEKDEDVMWKLLIENYASDGNTEKTKFLLDKLSSVSLQKDLCYEHTIKELEKKYNDVINPVSFASSAKGYWISLKNKKQDPKNIFEMMTIPEYFIDIDDLQTSAGAEMLASPTFQWDAHKKKKQWLHKWNTEKNMLRESQALLCDVDNKYLKMVFASEKMNEGNANFSHSMLEANRQFKAEMHGKINSSDGNFGQQLAGHVITEVIGGLFDALATGMAKSTKKAEGYEIELSGVSPQVMNASISYREVELDNVSGNLKTKNQELNKQYTFVKWEPSDSIIFINGNGKPMFVGSLDKDSPLLKEYNDVKKKYNFWKPKYIIPTVLGVGVGAFCITKGIKVLIDKTTPDSTKKNLKFFAWWMGGFTAIMVPSIWSFVKIQSNRLKAYNEINERSMEKMRKKAATLSISPLYNPTDHAIGMHLNLTF